ncbi:MAG: lysophospholipid acyltransferase family protein, partial [Thiohalomonadaceae bacterium]
MSISSRAQCFRLNGALSRHRWLERSLEHLSGLAQLEGGYVAMPDGLDTHSFLGRAIDHLDINYQLPDAELARIPLQGGVVVVANHPYGGLDGMILAHLLIGLRSDVRILANSMLNRVPELNGLFIGVDPYGGNTAKHRNRSAMREAVRWLQQGGLLLVFPAGEVSRLDRHGLIRDPAWSPSIARLIQAAQVPVLPVHVSGRNSLLFQLAGLLHPRLRTLLLPRELLNKAGHTVTLRIGQLIEFKHLPDDVCAMLNQLRMRSYLLGDLNRPVPRTGVESTKQLPLAAAQDPFLLQYEIHQLPEQQRLVQNGNMEVWYARAQQTPYLLQEIGRLREMTFREVGEGTGKASDLDLYDSYYLHLFVWNAEKMEMVGAYRLGLIDQILPHYGKKGLYTHSLFRYRRKLIEGLGPAIELGRSFIQPAYQRSFSPLLLLWKGIGEFVVRHPHYRILLGPVSISNDYHSLSRQLMVAFLQDNRLVPDLARQIQARTRFRGMGRRWRSNGYAQLADIETLSDLIAQIEGNGRGTPILLKQYLKMGGKLLGFNLDRQFSDAL